MTPATATAHASATAHGSSMTSSVSASADSHAMPLHFLTKKNASAIALIHARFNTLRTKGHATANAGEQTMNAEEATESTLIPACVSVNPAPKEPADAARGGAQNVAAAYAAERASCSIIQISRLETLS